MSEERLGSVAVDLAEILRDIDDRKRRAAAIAACRFAIERSGLKDSVADEALRAIAIGKKTQQLREKLEQITNDLDEEYWDLQQAWRRGEVEEKTYLAAFSRARAANAVLFALSEDSLTAAAEAIYEANAAADDLDELRRVVHGAIAA